MKSRGLIVSALILVGVVQPVAGRAAVRPSAPQGPRVPPSWPLSPTGPQLPASGVTFGAHVGIDPAWTGSDRESSQAAVETSIGRTLVIDRQYYFFDEQFPTAEDDLSRDQGRTLYISMTAFNSDGTVNLWKDIASGVYDATIDARAADIKAFGAPMFFTFHHEPNKGHQGVSAGTPAEFIAAWRHIHDKFVADGVTNVSWVLTLMAITYKNHKAGLYYPGGAYTDLLAADGYNWFGCNQPSGPWTEVVSIFQAFYAYGLLKNKPMLVAEWGTGEDPDDPMAKANWFTNGEAQFKLWPQIKGVSYYDSTHGHSDCPRWINTSTNSLDAFAAIGADPYSNPYPIITMTSGPANPTNATTATLTWNSTTGTGTSVTFACSLDNGPATACSSGKTYTGLLSGYHLFMVTPTDDTGAVGNPSAWEWLITGPVTTITSGPVDPTLDTSATFTFVGDKPGYTFTCSLDEGTGIPCASPTTYPGPLSVGSHTFSVFAGDGHGNFGQPATWTWTIATVGPTVSVADFSFSPPAADDSSGDAVLWNFAGPSDHTVTDATGMGLFDSGALGTGSTFFYQFIAAGFYAYTCTIHPTLMSGTVSVPMSIDPISGTVTTVFTLTWASTDAPAGFGYDLQILRPGATKWAAWGATKSAPTGLFTPDSGAGTYEFRARLSSQTTGQASAYSKAFAITVTD